MTRFLALFMPVYGALFTMTFVLMYLTAAVRAINSSNWDEFFYMANEWVIVLAISSITSGLGAIVVTAVWAVIQHSLHGE